ncbi:MAG TPA: hypothetical protein VGQ03_04370 [Nitrososphaera sp.]|jgi:hypothetical protein|nr:hypothetical protein [Nitrososphaera sp.]
MNSKLVFAGIFAGVLVASLVGVQSVLATIAGPGWAEVVSFTATAQNDNISKLTVTTNGEISRQPDEFVGENAVVGFAWADLNTGEVFVITIHPVLGRDAHQNPDSWHAHTATLSPLGGTGNPDFCVVSIDTTPTAGINIQGNTASVTVNTSDLPFTLSEIDGAVGFVINGGAAGCTSGLGVDVVV